MTPLTVELVLAALAVLGYDISEQRSYAITLWGPRGVHDKPGNVVRVAVEGGIVSRAEQRMICRQIKVTVAQWVAAVKKARQHQKH